MTDYFAELFGSPLGLDAAETAAMHARMAADVLADKARVSKVKADMAAIASAPRCSRCSRCGGSGMLTQFMHRNNGVCFGCGGTGRA